MGWCGEPHDHPHVRIERGTLPSGLREAVLDLWCAVNDAGGAVGFLPGAPRADVAAALSRHEAQMAAGYATAVLLLEDAADVEPGEASERAGRVVGLGFWGRGPNPLLDHTRTGHRIMTDPARRGAGLGRLLMDAMHDAARAEGVELVIVQARGGHGTERFYERCGYVETGRIPGVIRVAPGDDRDEITLARRLDGRPLLGA